jgi:cbb3-type cytochrome oxidase subunit 3
MLQANWIQNIFLVITAGALVAAIFFAYNTGKNSAASNAILQNANQLAKGFDYFKGDQDRFPSEYEYANQDLMSTYFSVFPPVNISDSICPNNFSYSAENTKSYVINFCLPRAMGVYGYGWNRMVSPPELE